MKDSTFYGLLKPYWANALILVLIVGAVVSPGDAMIGPRDLGLALPARWALLIMVGGGYVSGLYIGAASARRRLERPSVST